MKRFFNAYSDGFPGYNSEGAAAGLTYDTLVNGNIVHTKATVDYIAKHLHAQTQLYEPANQMNRIFYDLIKSGKLTYNANDYTKTIAKCDPAVEGGKLSWDDDIITTYHDLAYYLLSHMWRQSKDVLDTDTLPNGSSYPVTYNMVVPELRTMRLYKDGDKYSYVSDRLSSYNHGYIFNVVDDDFRKPIDPPFLQPINGRGFESDNLYGTATESSTDNANNYLFTIHAYGGFVYTESAKLNFAFTGDDDVYFYVNNQLICDIGGMHGAVSKSVNLNDYASTLKLKDGQICRFDMFYAERHTTGINLNFTTNIKIMDADVITEKTMYDTATNNALMDGAVVPVGSEIGYTFGMINRRSEAVKELTLTDKNIGIEFDGKNQTMTLNDKTKLSDLTVTYSSYDIGSDKAYAGKATVYDDFTSYTDLSQSSENKQPPCQLRRRSPS